MKTIWITALVGLSLMGAVDPASAQRDGRDYNEREYSGRGYGDRDNRDRSRGYDDDDDQGQERGRGYRDEREAQFDENEYLRCHPDVRQAVERGEMESGEFHYRNFGRREERRLTCETRL